MQSISFPYGKETMNYSFPKNQFVGELVSELHRYSPKISQWDLVREALQNPIGTPVLSVMAEGKKNVVLIASDHTRPVPSKIIVPQLLAEVRKGNPEAEITILISTGCHRESTKEELIEKFGAEIVENEKIIMHNCDTSPFVYCGKLPSGGDLILNEIAMKADLLISEGFIEPHFFAGFSGGRKSVLPGIANRNTVLYNHNAAFIDSPYARAGILENNPLHKDMLYAARVARLAFICNVVINAKKEVVYAVGGDCDLAHRQGCEFLGDKCRVERLKADIVITSNGGYPLDQNVYQAVKGMTAAEAVVRPGGVIIMLAKSSDGHGGDEFYKTFAENKDPQEILDLFLATPKEETRIDQWQSQILARILKHAHVIYISDVPDDIVIDMHMRPARTIDQAISIAKSILNDSHCSIAAIPDGVSVIVSE